MRPELNHNALHRLTGILWRLVEELPEKSKRKWKVAIEDFERVARGRAPREKVTPPKKRERKLLPKVTWSDPKRVIRTGRWPSAYEVTGKLRTHYADADLYNRLRLGDIVESRTGLYEPVMVWDNHMGDSRLEFQPRDWRKCSAGIVTIEGVENRILLHRRARHPLDPPHMGRNIVEAVWDEKQLAWRMLNPWGTVVDVDWTYWHWWMPAPKGPV